MSDTTDRFDKSVARLGSIANTLGGDVTAVLASIKNTLSADERSKISADLDKLDAIGDSLQSTASAIEAGQTPPPVTSVTSGATGASTVAGGQG